MFPGVLWKHSARKTETIKSGDKNTSVLLLQEILRARGFKGKNGKVVETTDKNRKAFTKEQIKNVVDAAENGNATKIPLIIIGNIICGFISLVIYRGAAILYNVEAKRAYANLCKNVFAKEIKLPFSYYEKHHSGEFISKISYDLEKMGSIYSSRLRRAVAPILQVIVYLLSLIHIWRCRRS